MQIIDIAPDLKLDLSAIKKASQILRAVNHKLRQQLLGVIHDEGRITVTQIYNRLQLEQSVASQHLAILRRAGFVLTEREGKFIFYSVNYNQVKQVQAISSKLLL